VQQPVIVKRESVIDHVADSWIECVMTAVWRMLDEQSDGAACITTPSGRACNVSVRFTTGGKA
jgi:hypothetical protein